VREEVLGLQNANRYYLLLPSRRVSSFLRFMTGVRVCQEVSNGANWQTFSPAMHQVDKEKWAIDQLSASDWAVSDQFAFL